VSDTTNTKETTMSTTTETKLSAGDLRPGMTVRITSIFDFLPFWQDRSLLDPENIDYISPEGVARATAEYLDGWGTTSILRTGQVKRSGEVVTVAAVNLNVQPARVQGRTETPQVVITLTDGRKFRSSTRQRVVLVGAA